MMTKRYLSSVKNLPGIMQKIVEGTAPERFTYDHLKNIGFTSSGDRTVIPLLKDLGFLSPDGAPTRRYHEYRNKSQSRKVLGQALKEAYGEVFHVNAIPTESDREAIKGLFKSTHNVSDRVAELQAMTFFGFLDLADIEEGGQSTKEDFAVSRMEEEATENLPPSHVDTLRLHYNIQIHLPAAKDIEIYHAIFKSLRENLLD